MALIERRLLRRPGSLTHCLHQVRQKLFRALGVRRDHAHLPRTLSVRIVGAGCGFPGLGPSVNVTLWRGPPHVEIAGPWGGYLEAPSVDHGAIVAGRNHPERTKPNALRYRRSASSTVSWHGSTARAC